MIVSNEESKSHWQQNDYKVLPVSVKDLKEADFSKLKAVQECPVQSAICQVFKLTKCECNVSGTKFVIA